MSGCLVNICAGIDVGERLEVAPSIAVRVDTAVREKTLVTQIHGWRIMELMATALNRLLKLNKIERTLSLDTLAFQNMKVLIDSYFKNVS